MHNNFHFFLHLVSALRPKLVGKQLLACFCQEKDELVMGFADESEELYIKCTVSTQFGGLYFSNVFHRAKQNSIDLFPEIIDLEVENAFVFDHERAIGITFKKKYCLVLKLFGQRSNVILFKNEKPQAIFNHRLPDDIKINKNDLNRQIRPNIDIFKAHNQKISQVFPTWGKIPKAYFEQNKSDSIGENWALCQKIGGELKKRHFRFIEWKGELYFSLLPLGTVYQEFDEPIEALNRFYVEKQKRIQFEQEKRQALKGLLQRKKQTEGYIQKTKERLNEVLSGPGNQEIGHLIMAYLHHIPEQATAISLPSFQTGKPVEIKLKSTLSAQKNAEAYYRKAKREKLEEDKLIENIEKRTAVLRQVEKQVEQIESQRTLHALRSLLKEEGLLKKSKRKEQSTDLFKHFEIDGFQVYVGKNAKNNDLLTLKHAHKNDLWLHAKDVSGSHVVIKQIPGKTIPKPILEIAAGLAAWFSKRRTDSLVPVIYTAKKFVRKVKGSPNGQVLVEKEQVMLIDPIDPTSMPTGIRDL